MPLMSPMPLPIEHQEIVVQNQILQQSGCKDIAVEEDELVRILNEEGGGIRDAVRNIALLSRASDNDSVRHLASRTILELHGKLGRKNDNDSGKVVINILQNSDSQVKLQGILNPSR